MTTALTTAAVVLWVYYAVSFTKDLVGLLSSKPPISNAIIRLWALILGVTGALSDYLLTAPAYDRLGIYTEIKIGAVGAVGAIATYHIGQKGFLNALGGTDDPATPPATATVTAGQVTTTVATTTPEVITGGAV